MSELFPDYRSPWETDDQALLRKHAAEFFRKEATPNQVRWAAQHQVDREFWTKAGAAGLLCLDIAEEYGGGGGNFGHEAIVQQEIAYAHDTAFGFAVHSTIVAHYIAAYATEDQKKRWLSKCASGESVLAIAMTEPGTGSDLANIATTAKLSDDGSHYLLNGAKTFITGGALADLVLVVCRTAASTPENRRGGLSILCVDTTSPGYSVGRKLQKIGLKASDTAELSFDNVRVPVEDRLGEEGEGFNYLTHNLAQERLTIALQSSAAAQAALRHALDYVKDRNIFGKPLAAFQNTKFVLAECATDVEAIVLMADRALELHDSGDLTVADAAKVKLFCTEGAGRVIDKCLQLHGGYGYVTEYPIARLYADTRVSRIYGGTSEVMKTIIAKSLGI